MYKFYGEDVHHKFAVTSGFLKSAIDGIFDYLWSATLIANKIAKHYYKQKGYVMFRAIVAAKETILLKAGVGEYGSDEEAGYADPGYQKDGKPRYPMKVGGVYDADRIRAGWNYIHKLKDAAKYTPEQLEKIKRRIIAAWKEKISKAGPPSVAKEGLLHNVLGAHEGWFTSEPKKDERKETLDRIREVIATSARDCRQVYNRHEQNFQVRIKKELALFAQLESLTKNKKPDPAIFDMLEPSHEFIVWNEYTEGALKVYEDIPTISEKLLRLPIPKTEHEAEFMHDEAEKIIGVDAALDSRTLSIMCIMQDHHSLFRQGSGQTYKKAGYTVDFPKTVLTHKAKIIATLQQMEKFIKQVDDRDTEIKRLADSASSVEELKSLKYYVTTVNSTVSELVTFTMLNDWLFPQALDIAEHCYK